MSMTFGEFLAACMEAAGFPSPASLSRATGISEGVLSRWLNDKGIEPPKVENLRKLEPALKVPLLELSVAAKVFTAAEARLDGEPQPPQPVDMEALYSMIDNSAMTDQKKEEVRAELERLRRKAQEKDRRSPVRRTDRSDGNGAEGDRRGA